MAESKLDLFEDLNNYLSIIKETGDREEEGKVYCNLGNAFQSLGNFQEAIE